MPSSSNLFVQLVFSLVARSAKTKGEVPLFCCSAGNATGMFFGPLLERMLFAVLGWRDQKKVFKAVVLGVAVFMVNVHAFWRACYPAMLVLPLVWLSNFYANVNQSVLRLVQFFCTNGELHANLGQHGATRSLGGICKRFSGAVRASWCVVVSVAVRSLFAHNGRTTKRAEFEWKFFGHKVFYTKQHRIANAF